MQTDILRPEQLSLVAPIVSGEFHNAMPRVLDQAIFYAGVHNEKLAGFVHIEHLFHFNCEYVAPEHRGSGLAMRLIREAAARIPIGYSAVWLTDRNAPRLSKALGARDMGVFRVYRKDV